MTKSSSTSRVVDLQDMIIALAADHAGYALKEEMKRFLQALGYRVKDFGAYSKKPSDYPDFVLKATRAVARSNGKMRGIVFGGSGIGEAIAANKVKGIRAAMVFNEYMARVTREHNDSNVLSLGSRILTPTIAKELVLIWLETPFSGSEKHARRIRKLAKFETRNR
ncbi:MAG: ribose 5-phosphate isomerase B [Bacteroidota bacterium]